MTALQRWAGRAGGFATALGLLVRALRQPTPRRQEVAERLTALPRHLPVEARVTIHWDAHQIPFIEAESDADLAVALGAVHAHLRLAQMELLRRLSQGRVAEVIGPLGVELDHALRLFDFGRAVPAIAADLDAHTRLWAEGFLRGVNAVAAHAPPPAEYALLGLRHEPWTLADLLTASRLAGADINWMVWGRLLRQRAELSSDEWREIWPRLLGRAAPPTPSEGAEAAVTAFARAGSNAAAVAGWRSLSGAAMLAADPHLSIGLPNVWLAAAFRSPSYQVAGLMPAGFPIVGIGRNEQIAWAGTSLHAASSDLVDASDLPMTERQVTVRVRGGGDRVLRLRDCEFGPIVSDGMILRHDRPLALAWMGHRPSNEMGAMLGVMRADGAEAFREALTHFALPGQNMIHAGRDGRVSHLLAVRVPRRPNRPPLDLIVSPEAARAAWADVAGTEAMPHWEGSRDGVVASANDAPPDGMQPPPAPVGFFFSPPERVRRLGELLEGEGRIGPDRLAAAQTDVHPPGVLVLRDLLLDRAGPASGPAVAALRTWGGGYDVASRGAVVFEVVLAELLATFGRRGALAAAKAVWTTRRMLAEEIAAMPDARLRPALQQALRAADRQLRGAGTWGAFHRMRLRHHLGAAPLLGRRFTYGGWPSPGSNDTLHKTGHPPARRRHTVSYGASARFVTDLAAPDANQVVLLGGQDGWLGSTTFLDQAPLWQRGDYLPLPLQAETARVWPFHTVITPAG